MKKLATIVMLLLVQAATAQVQVYQKGQLEAEGYLQLATNKLVKIRIIEGGQFRTRSIFYTSIDSVVVLDSATAQNDASQLALIKAPVIVRIIRPSYILQAKPLAQNTQNSAPRLAYSPEQNKIDMMSAGHEIQKGAANLILGTVVSLVGATVPLLITNRNPDNADIATYIGISTAVLAIVITVDGYEKIRRGGKILAR